MISSIHIADYAEAWDHARQIKTHNYSSWIITLDPDDDNNAGLLEEAFKNSGLRVLKVLFLDSRLDSDQKNSADPQLEDIEKIVAFLQELLQDEDTHHHLGINCFAGYSRSPAIATIAYQEMGYSKDQALKLVTEIRPIANPNPKILRLYEKLQPRKP